MIKKAVTKKLNFLTPPLIEVSLGIVFDPLTEFHAAHFGRFWSKFADDYPETTDRTAIVTPPPGVQNSLTPIPIGDWFRLPRVWFVHRNKSLLLQLQADRLYLNWLKQPEGHFPRFSGLFPQFKSHVDEWTKFVESYGLGTLNLRQFEIVYTNHIYKGALWSGFAEAGNVLLPLAFDAKHVNLPAPTWIAWQNSYSFDDCDVTADIKSAMRSDTRQDLLQFELKGTSGERTVSFSSIEDWFAAANAHLERVFLALTSRQAQNEEWGRVGA